MSTHTPKPEDSVRTPEVPDKKPYEAPKVESVQLSQEAAESLT